MPVLPLPPELRVGSVEPHDLPPCIALLLDCFYKDALTLAAEEFTEAEMEKLRPTLQAVNGVLAGWNRIALTETTKQRLGARLQSGGTRLEPVGCALMIAVQEVDTSRIVAIAELSTQPRDGKVPGDLRLPGWWPPQLPWARSRPSRDLECAYLSNLCVAAPWRKRGLAKSLLRTCEELARAWGYSELYLHAATKDAPLLVIQRVVHGEQLPDFDQPDWVLATSGREATRYHRRALPAPEAPAV